jgi:hypothetical protein
MKKVDIGIICQEFEHHENVETRRIAYGVQHRGDNMTMLTAYNRGQSIRAMQTLIAQHPLILHFHLRYPFATVLDLSLAGLARKMGYRGTITCSGTPAILDEQWIFQHADAVDGIVPTSVDSALHGLIQALKNGRNIHGVPGIRTRQEALFLPLLQTSPVPWRAFRDDVSQMMGIPIAGISATEGCAFRCSYCMHAAAARIASGDNFHADKKGGRCHQRRRPVDDLVDEMSTLYHRNGVRYFYFADENPLPGTEADALAWISDLQRHFELAGMKDLSLGLNTRGDRMTPAIIDALTSLGVIRTLMGVESGSASGLLGLGRKGDALKGIGALKQMANHGTLVWFNSLFLHPDSDVDSVAQELSCLRKIPNALFNTLKLRPFSGTDLTTRLAGMNRLRGNPLYYDYGFTSDVLNRFDRELTSFQIRSIGAYDPALRLHDLLLNVKLAQRHCAAGRIRRIAADVEQNLWALVQDVNAMRVDALQTLLTYCGDNRSCEAVQRNASLRFEKLDSLLTQQERRLSLSPDAIGRPYAQIAAAATLLFSFAGSIACNTTESVDVSTDDTFQTDDNDDSASLTDEDTATDDTADTKSSDDSADTITSEDTDDTATGDSQTDTIDTEMTDTSPDTATGCDMEEREAMAEKIRDIILSDTHCAGSNHYTATTVWVDKSGKVAEVTLCDDWSDTPEAIAALEQCFLELFADEVFPCFSNKNVGMCPLYIE